MRAVWEVIESNCLKELAVCTNNCMRHCEDCLKRVIYNMIQCVTKKYFTTKFFMFSLCYEIKNISEMFSCMSSFVHHSTSQIQSANPLRYECKQLIDKQKMNARRAKQQCS